MARQSIFTFGRIPEVRSAFVKPHSILDTVSSFQLIKMRILGVRKIAMPSHMSSIGFHVQTLEETKNLIKQAVVQAGQTNEVRGVGYYRQWSPGKGIELWVNLDQKIQILGMEPHFTGDARMKVRLSKRVLHPKNTILEGAFYGWANPHGGHSNEGDYPFCFSAPDYRLHDDLKLPSEVTVQLAAFPNELLAYENEHDQRTSDTWMKQMAPQSCIPSGLFLPGGQKIDPPKPEIMFCGIVQETSTLKNPITGHEFCWAKVRTLGGELDVVADPSAVKGVIKKDGVVGSMCWLSGRIK